MGARGSEFEQAIRRKAKDYQLRGIAFLDKNEPGFRALGAQGAFIPARRAVYDFHGQFMSNSRFAGQAIWIEAKQTLSHARLAIGVQPGQSGLGILQLYFLLSMEQAGGHAWVLWRYRDHGTVHNVRLLPSDIQRIVTDGKTKSLTPRSLSAVDHCEFPGMDFLHLFY